MTEEAWLTCADTLRMLTWLKATDQVSDRKQYLLDSALWNSRRQTRSAMHQARFLEQCGAAYLARWAEELGIENAIDMVASIKRWGRTRELQLLRCIFGNPFGAVSIEPSWLTPAVIGLAQDAYRDRTDFYNYLDWARLAALATALEAVGCIDATLLGHLREPGPHVRGCWVLDRLLGNE